MSRHVTGSASGFATRLALSAATLGVFALKPTGLGAQRAPSPHAVQPERHSVATHAGTVAPGWLEIEAGIERDRLGPETPRWPRRRS